MPRDFKLYLRDILDAIENIKSFTRDDDFEKFKQDRKTYHAVVFNLEIIGEAVKNLPENLKQDYPEVEWKKIGVLRNIIAHQYFELNVSIVWDVVENKLCELRTVVLRMQKNHADL